MLMTHPVHWPAFMEVTERILGSSQGSLAVQQFLMFQEGAGIFGTAMARASMGRMEPYAWWKCYGASTPQLQLLAMKVLSQPSSASSSEQSWSEYDFIHNKKRNRLQVTVARNLVYVHANMRLLQNLRSYDRYSDLMEESRRATSSEALRSELLNDGWDGDCDEEDVDLERIFSELIIEAEELELEVEMPLETDDLFQ